MKKRALISLLLCLAMSFALVSCGGTNPSGSNPSGGQTVENNSSNQTPSDTLELKMGTTLPATSVNAQCIDQWAADVYEKTNGRIHIDVYHGAQLGSETEMIEQCMMGALDFMLSSVGTLSNWFDKLAIEDLPYMWADISNARAAYDGAFGEYIINEINSSGSGLHTFGSCELGIRNITANTPVYKVSDMAGMKLRVTESPLRLEVFNLYGAQPVSMNVADVYSALQQGVLDGQENPLIVVIANSYWEVQDYLSMTGHFYTALLFHCNETLWNSFTEEEREIITQSALEARQNMRDGVDQYESDALQQCIDNGMQVVYREDIDVEGFKNAAQPIYEKYFEVFGPELTQLYKDASGWEW